MLWMIKNIFIFYLHSGPNANFWTCFNRSFSIIPKKVFFALGPDLVSSTSETRDSVGDENGKMFTDKKFQNEGCFLFP